MMKGLRKTTLVGVTVLLLCAGSGMEARAQRTMRGESLLTLEGHYPFSSPYWMGYGLSYGRYLLSSCWKAGVSATEYSHPLGDDVSMGYLHAAAYGEWMYRLAGTRNRILCLYGGAGAFLGYEVTDAWNLLPASTKEGYGSGYFLYGLSVSAELELFFCRRAAVVLRGRLPVNFTSQFGALHAEAGAGIRLNIF